MAEQTSADYRGNLGRYALFGEIAAGGMATVHLARLLGSVGFARTVAIKRLHPHLAKDPDFVAMFLEEARLAARVRHPNVVATLDVVSEEGELFLVMEYVPGESLSRLARKTREAGKRIPHRYVAGMMCSALEGLHAAHEATSERGQPLGMVHRDISPQNVHVGLDGVARVLDFGIAKANSRVIETRTDQIKGKVAYMSPEQLAKGNVDRRADLYSASVVLWEALAGRRLFKADDVAALVYSIINEDVPPPSKYDPSLPASVDAIVMRGLDRDADNRFATAREMAVALERAIAPAPAREIGAWVKETAGDALEWRMELVHRIEAETSQSLVPPVMRDSPLAMEVSSGVVQAPQTEPASNSVPKLHADEDDEEHRPTLLLEEPARPHHRSPFVLAAVGLVVLAAVGLGVRLVQLRLAPPTEPVVVEHVLPDPPSASLAIGLELSRAPSATVSASASAPPPTPPPAATPAPPPQRWVAPAPAKPPSDCDNPFYTDARGQRHPKPHCFKR